MCEGQAHADSSGALQDAACTHSRPGCRVVSAQIKHKNSQAGSSPQTPSWLFQKQRTITREEASVCPGEIRLLLSCLDCVATHALGASGSGMGWVALHHNSGLGQVPSPLTGHEVQQNLQGLHSRLRQGQTRRRPGQTGTKAREIVHKSDGFTFPLSPLKHSFHINSKTYRSNSETNFRKRSENENFRPDFLFPWTFLKQSTFQLGSKPACTNKK